MQRLTRNRIIWMPHVFKAMLLLFGLGTWCGSVADAATGALTQIFLCRYLDRGRPSNAAGGH
jgi:hypothetical protein